MDIKWHGSQKELLRLKETLGELYCQEYKDLAKNNLCLKMLIAFSTVSFNTLDPIFSTLD